MYRFDLAGVTLFVTFIANQKRNCCVVRPYLLKLCLLYILLPLTSLAQPAALHFFKNAPSQEIYDLLKDRKGYLWLGHDLGISRFDGTNFISLDHPLQNSASMTDLAEDRQGRIWCHNFNGQIFYEDSMRLHLLTQYKYNEEVGYPRTVICGDELIATSIKGVFVMNTGTFASRYYPLNHGSFSVACLGRRVVLQGPSGWYCYEPGKGIKNLRGPIFPNTLGISLQPRTLKDTIFLITNPNGAYYKLLLQGDSLHTVAQQQIGHFINTITITGGKPWIHTKQNSFTEDRSYFFPDLNLSNALLDAEGYLWLSSLKNGLGVQYNNDLLNPFPSHFLSPGDFIRKVLADGRLLLCGTQNGWVYVLDPYMKPVFKGRFAERAGAVENIFPVAPGKYLIAASLGAYMLDIEKKTMTSVHPALVVKDVYVNRDQVLLATTSGLKFIPLPEVEKKNGNLYPESFHPKSTRCRSVTESSGRIIAAYSDGVYEVSQDTVKPILYNGQPVYATCVRTVLGETMIGTYRQGLLVIKNGLIASMTMQSGLVSNSIKDLRVMPDHVWVVYHDYVQKLNLARQAESDYHFPYLKDMRIIDMDEKDGFIYLVTNDGVFTSRVHSFRKPPVMTVSIDRVVINGIDTVGNRRFTHSQNSLQFHVSTPFFSQYSRLDYRYRIKTRYDSTWQTAAPGQQVFSFVSMDPGHYVFEVMAINESGKALSPATQYDFLILPPWYQTIWFRLALVVVLSALVFAGFAFYFKRRLQHQQSSYEKLIAVQQERQRISAEMHDDIGASLSGIRLLTEMTRHKVHDGELYGEVDKIHHSITEIAAKMKEVIWSLNSENDQLEHLVYYMRQQAFQLFENSSIHLQVQVPQQIAPVEVNGERRRHIYLAVKEALHNCIKHSSATSCSMNIIIREADMHILVKDDGVGIGSSHSLGNGLLNMKKRMEAVKGYFHLENGKGTAIKFVIPITLHT
jgi:signal transduction histidine kinase